jgi:hypothetical protein
VCVARSSQQTMARRRRDQKRNRVSALAPPSREASKLLRRHGRAQGRRARCSAFTSHAQVPGNLLRVHQIFDPRCAACLGYHSARTNMCLETDHSEFGPSFAQALDPRCTLDSAHHEARKVSEINAFVSCVWRIATRAHFYRSSRCESVMSSTFGTHL